MGSRHGTWRPAALVAVAVLTAATPSWGEPRHAAANGTLTRRVAVHDPAMHKVTLTQIGYIQFLRYIVDVPALQELTFCVWLRSSNLTHNHPIFSYSRNEKERLVRAWVSPPGQGPGRGLPARLHVLVMERAVLVEPLPEAALRRWLHVCASWDGLGQYRLYVDGRQRRAGVRQEVAGLTLPAGGDIVVGQEYTDFDKGLDDGVEGELFGFYLFRTATPSSLHPADPDDALQRHLQRARRRADGRLRDAAGRPPSAQAALPVGRRSATSAGPRPKRQPSWRHAASGPQAVPQAVPQRVRRLYAHCTERLAPEDRADAVVSWPSTPVRVFGGAIISNVSPGCGSF